MVNITYQNIYTNLPEKQLVTLDALNEQISGELIKTNDYPLTGKECSRNDQRQMELFALQSLPTKLCEIRKMKQVTIMKNGYLYLSDDQHYYNVPYELIGKKLKLHYSRSQIELYLDYQLIATHKRVRSLKFLFNM